MFGSPKANVLINWSASGPAIVSLMPGIVPNPVLLAQSLAQHSLIQRLRPQLADVFRVAGQPV
jgi:hypothetical protein